MKPIPKGKTMDMKDRIDQITEITNEMKTATPARRKELDEEVLDCSH